jgi:hypothetical protein
MDPITTAIVATLPVLASDLVKSSVKDAYEALKSVIRRKWGTTSALSKSLDDLEANPQSKGQATVLAEKVSAAKATADVEVMEALAKLVDELKKEGIGGKVIAAINIKISGGAVQGIVGAENVSVGSINFGTKGGREDI